MWPATVTPTISVLAAFHCARRLRVFARDILRLGVAMVGPHSSIRGFACMSRGMAGGPNGDNLGQG